MGRLGLALSDNRPPRLVVDSSICGLNSQVAIPERTTLPSALDVLRVYPPRNLDESLLGFSLDVKSATQIGCFCVNQNGAWLDSLWMGQSIFTRSAPLGHHFRPIIGQGWEVLF